MESTLVLCHITINGLLRHHWDSQGQEMHGCQSLGLSPTLPTRNHWCFPPRAKQRLSLGVLRFLHFLPLVAKIWVAECSPLGGQDPLQRTLQLSRWYVISKNQEAFHRLNNSETKKICMSQWNHWPSYIRCLPAPTFATFIWAIACWRQNTCGKVGVLHPQEGEEQAAHCFEGPSPEQNCKDRHRSSHLRFEIITFSPLWLGPGSPHLWEEAKI